MLAQVQSVIDWFFNAIYTVISWYKTHGGIWFYLTIIVVFIYPFFHRVVKSLRSSSNN